MGGYTMRKIKKAFIVLITILFVIPNGSSIFAATNDKVNLVDSKASENTKKLFAYLRDSSGKRILFGQQHATDEGLTLIGEEPRVASKESEVKNAVGDYPAMFGWDTLSLDGYEKPGVSGDLEQSRKNLVKSVQDAHKLGAVISLSTHPYNFVTGGNFNDTTGDVVANILPGGSHNTEFNVWLDNIALFASEIKDENGELIPVTFRPFHEQTGGWFWWGSATTTTDEYIALVRYTIEYLRDVKEVRNFLYAYSPNAPFGGGEERYLTTYPGDDYIDILGMDKYDSKSDAGSEGFLSSTLEDLAMIVDLAEEKGKIPAFTEYGYSPEGMHEKGNTLDWYTKLFNAIKADPKASKISYMQTWANFGWPNNMFVPYRDVNGNLGGNHELLPDFIKFYKDEYSAFREDIKGFYQQYGVIETEAEKPFTHIVSPIAGSAVTESTPKVRVKVLHDKPTKVAYTVDGSDDEVEMTLDEDGVYYTADWSLPVSANGEIRFLTVKTYQQDEVKFEEKIKVFVKFSNYTIEKLTFDNTIEGIKNNGTYPESNISAFEHAQVAEDGKLKFQVRDMDATATWQELKMELTDLSTVDLTTVNRVKFDVLVPESAGENAEATLRAVAQLPPDWDMKYGESTTNKNFVDLEKVTINHKEYRKYVATIDMLDQTKLTEATSLAISLVGSGLNLSEAVYIDNVELINTYIEPAKDPAIVDDFESYLGDAVLLKKGFTLASGDEISISLSETDKIEGLYGLKYDYTLASSGYAGITKQLAANWSEYNTLKFWLVPDGKNQKMVIQVKIDGVAYEAYPSLDGTDADWVSIPFSELSPAPWESEANKKKALTKKSLENVTEFSIYVNSVDGEKLTSTLYFDDIRAVYEEKADGMPNGDGKLSSKGDLLFDFEDGVKGWGIGYDENATTEPKVTKDSAINNGSLVTSFDFAKGKFSLQTTSIGNLVGEKHLFAKVKLSQGTAKAKLYIQTGAGWDWYDSGVITIEKGVQVLKLDLTAIENLDAIQSIGLEILPVKGNGKAFVYLDDVSLVSPSE